MTSQEILETLDSKQDPAAHEAATLIRALLKMIPSSPIMPLGEIRKIDNLGRIVIPKGYRVISGWTEGTLMEYFHMGEFICAKKYSVEKRK
ncbi:MAG: AbrB/MazE/SpoVT family DNA-binding domain-containing protein [Oscillospiraceae bacterium]|jgi:hypothetical protein|nr:AbrB/MazE/SpoVT family DNA-binding domain-containing protein [Oscillospiraceae bacterium]